jgi:hypothetical protein
LIFSWMVMIVMRWELSAEKDRNLVAPGQKASVGVFLHLRSAQEYPKLSRPIADHAGVGQDRASEFEKLALDT